jgi:hypothetical protein
LVEVEATSTLASTDNVDVDGDAEFAAVDVSDLPPHHEARLFPRE